MQLFQRRRWINPGQVDAGLDAFVRQLAWIDAHTALAMAGWRRDDSDSGPGDILASTIYDDHAWFLAEVARLQTLIEYAPVNETAAALMSVRTLSNVGTHRSKYKMGGRWARTGFARPQDRWTS